MVSLGSVRVRVSINIKLFALYFIHRYLVDGATGVATLGTRIGVPTLGSRTTATDDGSRNLKCCRSSSQFVHAVPTKQSFKLLHT